MGRVAGGWRGRGVCRRATGASTAALVGLAVGAATGLAGCAAAPLEVRAAAPFQAEGPAPLEARSAAPPVARTPRTVDGGARPLVDTVRTGAAAFTVVEVADGLSAPVALAFLPDGRGLLAERKAGRVSVLDPTTGARTPVDGLPAVWTEQDGGLLDVVVGPEAGEAGGDRWIYLAYAEEAGDGSTTVLDRARLGNGVWVDRERLFRSDVFGEPIHYGGRIAFQDGYVFLTIGDRGARDLAQSPATLNGTVVRLHLDGTVPGDNPFVGVDGARPEVWSYGHRNAQGMAVHPATGRLWVNEHGPRGGDEVNVVRPGANYGWPRVTYGEEYGGGPVGDGRSARPGLEPPIWMWRPSIGPSGLVFYRGAAFPGWRSTALVGAMALEHLAVLTLVGDRVVHEARVLQNRGWRIRLVAEDGDGRVWLGTDSGLLLRLDPVTGG